MDWQDSVAQVEPCPEPSASGLAIRRSPSGTRRGYELRGSWHVTAIAKNSQDSIFSWNDKGHSNRGNHE